MLIDCEDKKLFITQLKAELKPRHFSQFNDWGFIKIKDSQQLVYTGELTATLPKVIAYLEKNKLPFQLSANAQALQTKLFSANTIFQNVLSTGAMLKNGEFDKSDFNKHLAFLNSQIPRELKDHQKKASYHLWLVGNGANFSVPGAGKTTVVLSVYERLRLEGKVNTLFVVGPPACFGPWKAEFEVVLGRKPNCSILAGGDSSLRKSEYFNWSAISDLYLTTFQTLLNDEAEVATFLASKNIKAMLVIDEAHYIKRINGNWANSVLNVARHAKFRCVLTGTPIPKSYSDLFNLYDFLWPDEKPISEKLKARLRILEEKKDYTTAGELLEPKVGPLFYRVRKTELHLKPQVFNEPEIVSMNPYERKVYDAIAKKIKSYAKADYIKNIDLIERLRRGRMIRLRQCLSYTKLLSTAIEAYEEDLIEDDTDLGHIISNYDALELPAKLSKLLEKVDSFQKHGEKVVIWSNFIGTIGLIEAQLLKKGFRCKKIIGETPIERTAIAVEETRESIRNEFVDEKSGLDILIANPAACAESISLHKSCHNAVYYELSYNLAQFLQSLDRIHRVGGSEMQPAYYHFLQYENTIDQDILANLEGKAQRMYKIIEGDYNIYSLDMFEDSDELSAYQRLFLQNDANIQKS